MKLWAETADVHYSLLLNFKKNGYIIAQKKQAEGFPVKSISQIASRIQGSATMAIDALAKQMKADGIDVVSFGAGEPDFNTPDHIKDAARRALDENFTHYTPATGTLSLKQSICKRMKEDCGVTYNPSQVIVTSGAKHCIYVALETLLNPGDEVIIPAPFWVSYMEMVQMAGGKAVVVYADETADFKITPEQLENFITEKTKAIILNNPCNPTGTMYRRDELKALADVCVANDLYIISDEIYYCLVYDGLEFTSVASLGDEIKKHTILVNGVSKAYAMTGWRIGYILCEPDLAQVISKYLSQSTGSPSSISQAASEVALSSSQESVADMRRAFEERRDYIVSRINGIEGVSCRKPEGAFYIMMNIEKLLGKTIHGVQINTSEDFTMAFLKYGLVATVPGTAFCAPKYVRWSYAVSMDNIREGMDRLEAFLNEK